MEDKCRRPQEQQIGICGIDVMPFPCVNFVDLLPLKFLINLILPFGVIHASL